MKKKYLSLVACLSLLFSGCLQWDLEEKAFTTISLEEVEPTSCNTAVARGRIVRENLSDIMSAGYVWSSVNPRPRLNDNEGRVEMSRPEPTFDLALEFSEAFTTYYVSAFVITEFGEVYSEGVHTVNTGWHQGPGFSGGSRDDGAAFAIGDYAYVGLGIYGGSNIFRRFNSITGTWDKIIETPFPGLQRCCPISFSVGGKAYVGTGSINVYTANPTIYNDFYEFDPDKVDGEPWTKIDPLPEGQGRFWGVSFVVGGKAYIGGGGRSSGVMMTFFRLDQGNGSWDPINPIPIQNVDGSYFTIAAFTTGGRAFVVLRNREVWEYLPDLGMGIWEKRPEMEYPGEGSRVRMLAWSFPNKAYCGFGLDDVGGADNFSFFNDLWEFDLDNPAYWTKVTPEFPAPGRNDSMEFLIGDKGYLVGGCLKGFCALDELWEFCSR